MSVINGNFRQYELDNGLVVALQNTSTQTVSAKLRVNYGASHQRPGEEGMAHFLEHCLVTGGSVKYDPIQADKIRGDFGFSNAFTSVGRTFFVGETLTGDLEHWLDYTADHVLRPRFDKDRVNSERERVLREISDAKSGPKYLRGMEIDGALYGNHPAGIFVLGGEEVVRDANLEKISGFHRRGYGINNMDLIVAGGLPDNTYELVQQYFGGAPIGENTRREFPQLRQLSGVTVLHQSAPEMKNMDNLLESSAKLSLAFNVPSRMHPDTYALRTMSKILGEDTNSLLFQNVGLRRGLAYSVGTRISDDYNAGIMCIGASVPSVRQDEAIEAIFEEMDKIKKTMMSPEAVERVKKMSQFSVAKTFETNNGHINAIEMKMDDGITPENYIAGYGTVTLERVKEVANRYIPDRKSGNYLLTIQDPLKD